MKQILVISGKGGTGKTVITSSFATIVKNKVMVDCDVDAADLHILLQPEIKEATDFKSGFSPCLDQEKCVQCGKCIEACRFEAIRKEDQTGKVEIDLVDCEGCGFCNIVCPNDAIIMKENIAGQWFVSETRFGPMVHAKLGVAEENSGKLVSKVRQKAKELADGEKCDWIIIDGSPGIGCPVIASLSGIDLAVVITEPTMSGLHDADRVIQVAQHFKVPVAMVINKYDLNETVSEKIERYCKRKKIEVIGRVKFDEAVVKSLMAKKTIVEYSDSSASQAIKEIWQRISNKFVANGI